MKYTIKEGDNEKSYDGFEHWTPAAKGMAIAVFDGDAELYAVDPDNLATATEEIVRYYVDAYDRGPSILTFYKQVPEGPKAAGYNQSKPAGFQEFQFKVLLETNPDEYPLPADLKERLQTAMVNEISKDEAKHGGNFAVHELQEV